MRVFHRNLFFQGSYFQVKNVDFSGAKEFLPYTPATSMRFLLAGQYLAGETEGRRKMTEHVTDKTWRF